MKIISLIVLCIFLNQNLYAQTAPVVFACDSNAYQVTGSTPNLYEFKFNSSTFTNKGAITLYKTSTPSASVSGAFQLRAIGYNPADNFAYGIKNLTDTLVKLGSNGFAVTVGKLTGSGSADFTSTVNCVAADFGPLGYLYVMMGGATNRIYVINVTTANIVDTFSTTAPFDKGDLIWNTRDALFYSIGTDSTTVPGSTFKLYSFPLGTAGAPATLKSKTLSPIPSVNNIGALFTDNTGSIYGANNADGNLYKFDTSGTFTFRATGASTTVNDGFSCPSAVILPVRLISLTATHQDAGIILVRWETANESDISSYDIEYSSDGSTYTRIHTTAAVGDRKNLVTVYSYAFGAAATPQHFFRLKIHDKGAGAYYSSTVLTSGAMPDQQLTMSSNLLKQGEQIFLHGKAGTDIVMYNLNGSTVMQFRLSEQTTQINTNALSAGLYIISVTEGDKKEWRKLFIY
ncbi:MAG: T9SS type A sorting domain-containing protein [Chitinophagaceae bacterium]|nr:T9SS type A sorting domain-containing protein [Chitinophagaceae bacterium]